ncbi:MAG: NAD-dependent deacylase [Anaerolineae bacterium]|nr:NAD-dependent deacylase [Anaerolineae bacterium]
MASEQLLERARELLGASRHTVALTGAGVSTRSGIPDFRTPNSGLWHDVDPLEVASIASFRAHPERFYAWLHAVASKAIHALPNPAHIALAQLEQFGPLQSIITQNIDALHTRAGSKKVFELHGTLRRATCMQCQTNYDARALFDLFLETGAVPHCPRCDGVLKPDVILYGETLPWRVWAAARQSVRLCDVLLVAGSSLEVAPSADLPLLAKHTGAKLIIVNYTPTFADAYADVVIHDDVADVLPLLAVPFLHADDIA